MLITTFPKAVGLHATFRSLSTDQFTQRLKKVHNIPDVFALALAEDFSVYRDDPDAWVVGTDVAIQDVRLDLLLKMLCHTLKMHS